jgi:hypothetical protein
MYMIGEILNNFTKDSIAYCNKGKLEGTFILCNLEAENRLYHLRPDGEVVYDFYFGIDETIEDKKEWIFVNEIEDEVCLDELHRKIAECIIKSIKKGYEFKVE